MTLQPFEDVVAAHGSTVLRVCRAVLSPSDADDAWSETFLSALRAYPELRPDSNVVGWLVTIAHRKAIDAVRRNARLPQLLAAIPELATFDVTPSSDHDPDLWAAFESLTDRQRQTITLHHLGGFPYSQVGALLNTTESAARRSASDGLATLRASFVRGVPT